jgi:hypothetical protein
MSRDYVGPLLETSMSFDFSEDDSPCGLGDWKHTSAISNTLFAICLGNRVTLTRRAMTPTYDEKPGIVSGQVVGASTNGAGQIYLGVELDSGETVAVDVTNPRNWHWEVH